ncbi:MAG: aspartate aminotransferase [Planctomycetota bacterium]|jgi:aspartate aminotransferase
MDDQSNNLISTNMVETIRSASWIRQMFEEGNRLRAKVGAENVFDFSLGNPSAPPPPEFKAALIKTAQDSEPADHRYMTNVGRFDTRTHIAEELRDVHGDNITPDHVVMTCGAAGGLNVFLKSVLNEGDEVILLKPYFPEYQFYIGNHGGLPILVDTDEDFQPDLKAIEAALTDKTRAIILNTPNNPSGVVYNAAIVDQIGTMVERHSEANNRPTYLIMDEPYRRIIYCDEPHPSVLKGCRYGVVISSMSKELGLAGERIGFVIVNPRLEGHESLISAMSVATRTLGFVNAPAFMQRVLTHCGHACVDLTQYRKHRDMLYEALTGFGYEMPVPNGAFFLFPKAPGGDDLAFLDTLRKFHVLSVPGRGFGTPGYIRISYAVPTRTVESAIPLFKKAFDQHMDR